MLEILENKSRFSDSELIQMVKRENNAKRNYLLVNSKQGKHIPADPDNILDLFRQLAECVKQSVKEKRIVFIGFAETATAVGAGVASHFEGSFYIHTTREVRTDSEPVAEFREEHSHAVEQLLYCDKWDEIISGAEHIIFAEDEISTGRTIMNFVKVLKENRKVPENIRFSACSILNGMSAEREKELAEEGMSFYYLLKHRAEPDSTDIYSFIPDKIIRQNTYELSECVLNGRIDIRSGAESDEYIKACAILAERVSEAFQAKELDIAVIGTEECMYPAINTACVLKRAGAVSVVTHSTTRSPIVAERSDSYPLKSRYQVESFYEKERKTYIYNSDLKKYDAVIIVTDSEKSDYNFSSFADAFAFSEKFILVRWVK